MSLREAAPEFGSKAVGVDLRSEEVVTQLTAGGGGWGDPGQRDPRLVERDCSLGYISARSALQDYLVVIGDDGSVNEAATAELRSGRTRAGNGDAA